jgi:hypothetical protein
MVSPNPIRLFWRCPIQFDKEEICGRQRKEKLILYDHFGNIPNYYWQEYYYFDRERILGIYRIIIIGRNIIILIEKELEFSFLGKKIDLNWVKFSGVV